MLSECSAFLAHLMLGEKLNLFGIMGCMLCITGSVTIVLHAPPERHLGSVVEVWQLAMQPGRQSKEEDHHKAAHVLHHQHR